jgi:hypothetical protein
LAGCDGKKISSAGQLCRPHHAILVIGLPEFTLRQGMQRDWPVAAARRSGAQRAAFT